MAPHHLLRRSVTAELIAPPVVRGVIGSIAWMMRPVPVGWLAVRGAPAGLSALGALFFGVLLHG